MIPFTHRETWLHAAADKISPWFTEVGAEVPQVRISCGWSKRSGKAIGWCWHKETAGDEVNQIYISPELDDSIQVLGTLVHEMVHASDNGKSKHSGHFRATAKALGLTGKMTATTIGDELAAKLRALVLELGEYPHAKITPAQRMAKQGTRMLKMSCPSCGYTARTTHKWLEVGMPVCPCGTGLVLD